MDGFYFDMDGDDTYYLGSNGTYDEGEDYAVRGRYWSEIIGNDTSYTSWYSEHIIAAAADNGITVPASATHIPTVDEDYEYWKDRSATYWFDEIAAYRDDVLFIVIATEQDHIQAASNHPHIQMQYDSLINGGIIFARVNPDKAYVQSINSSYTTAVDNDAFATINNDNIAAAVEPESITHEDLQLAAACELADRKHDAINSLNLDHVLSATESSATTSSTFTTHSSDVDPSTIFGSTGSGTSTVSNGSISTSFNPNCFWTQTDYVTNCLDEIAGLPTSYEFFSNSETGELMYGDPSNPCAARKLDCIKFCPWNTMDNVISASAVTLTNENDQLPTYILDRYAIASDENEFEDAEMGKWHVSASYTYKDEISNIYDDDDHSIYQAGMMNDFVLFNWENTDELAYTKWMKTSDYDYYSPNGGLLQETNILGVSSVSKENNQNLPYLVAYNASYDDVLYESFENPHACTNSDGVTAAYATCFDEISTENTTDNPFELNGESAHTGKYSLLTTYTGSEIMLTIADEKELSEQSLANGIIVKFWSKSQNNNWPDINFVVQRNGFESSTEFVEVARTGEWVLYQSQATFDNNPMNNTSSSNTYSAYIKIEGQPIVNGIISNEIYLDDVRLQPSNSQLIGYVYDPTTFKLLSQFDDQHFASNYQYNQEGKLVRIIRETERGLKTIKETHYNMPLQSKN